MKTLKDKVDWELRGQEQRIATNADQTEMLAMKMGACPIDEGIRDETTAAALDDFGSQDQSTTTPWSATDNQADDAVGGIANEIVRRKDLMGPDYPFSVSGNELTYVGSKTKVYELCLAIANAPSVNVKPYNALPPLFERITRDIVKNFAGDGSVGIRTGWPKDSELNRTTYFKSVVDIIHKQTNEWEWSPKKGYPKNPPSKHVKDMGIDFVVWKKMPDNRKGMLFLLGQCACGNDWDEKYNDINFERLSLWFRDLSVACPSRIFAIPFHIPNTELFEEVNKLAGLTLDRARIAMLAESASNIHMHDKESCDNIQKHIDIIVNAPQVA